MRCFNGYRIQFGLLFGLWLSLIDGTVVMAQAPKAAPIQVDVSHPVAKQVIDYVERLGHISAPVDLEIRARVSGFLEQIHVQEGQRVKKGDLLFEVDPRPYQIQLELATAQVRASQALLKKARAIYERSRTLSLKSPGTISELELIEHQVGVEHAEAALQISEANLKLSQLNLSYTMLRSPIDGQVGQRLLNVGSLVKEGESLLTNIVSVGPMQADFDVDDRTALRVRRLYRDQAAQATGPMTGEVMLRLSGDSLAPQVGTINFVDNQIDVKTGLLKLRAIFENKDETFIPGMQVLVRIPVGTPRPALLIGYGMINFDEEDSRQTSVFIVSDKNTVIRKSIKVGALHDGLHVVEEGLKADDRIIVTRTPLLKAGQMVEAKLVELAPPSEKQDAPRVPKFPE